MGPEKYISIACLGLCIMFVGEIISLYNFLVDPFLDFDADAKLFQFISIGVAPACIMAGTTYFMSRRYGSKFTGSMILSGGIVLLIGMIIANYMINGIDPKYVITSVTLTPPLFMIVSILMIVVGASLFRLKKRRPKKEYV